jgi:hypothetical protein
MVLSDASKQQPFHPMPHQILASDLDLTNIVNPT